MNKELIGQHFIGGQWVDGQSEEIIQVLNKYDGSVLKEFSLVGIGQKENIIMASMQGFKSLRKWSVEERANCLKLCAKYIQNHFKLFKECIAMEAGKPISYAKGEVERAIFNLNWCSEEIKRINGEVINVNFMGTKNRNSFTKRYPIGPILGISPFNFPLNLALHKIAPAVAAGCSITLKPSPQAPLSALLLGQMAQESGLPDGALNVILSDVETSETLVRDEHFKCLSFTGSPKIGWYLKSIAGKKKVLLELGGNAPIIIDKGVDIDAHIESIVKGIFLYSGQICISTQRLIVLGDIYEEFIQSLLIEIKKLEIGDPMDEETVVGPVIDKKALFRIKEWIDEAVAEGATILHGGHVKDATKNIFEPTLLASASKNSKVCKEEAFGPLATVHQVSTFQQALELANDTQFGLQVGVFTNTLEHMKMAMEELEYGGVLFNSIPGFRCDHMPYGGIKESGLGREGAKYAIQEFTEPRLFVF